MDVLEILLDSFTDFKKFERLATEVMTLEGYGTIAPIGGVDDEGVDAEVVKFLKDEVERVVFQFTIQENVGSKINDTIKKLRENEIDFTQLVIVTKNEVNNIQKYRSEARVKQKANLEIFDKKTFIKHLSTDNALVTRYFPDAKAQLNSSLFDRKSILSDSRNLETSLLKCSLLFTFNPKAEGKRKTVFDHTVLSLIVSKKDPLDKLDLLALFKVQFGKEVEAGEIDASLSRLKKDQYVELKKNNKVNATTVAIEKIEGNLSKINSATEALIDDIVSKIKNISTERLDKRTEGIITNNIKQSLSAYFRLYGLEYSHEYSFQKTDDSFQGNKDLISLAKKSVNDKLGDVIVYAIGETLNSPTEEQTKTLANWARAFVGAQLMGFDSKLSNFQATRINQKTFVLDTDFLLYCIVSDCKRSSTYIKAINNLLSLSCKIIIPEEIVHECIKHAEFAYRSYNYFRTSFDTLDSVVIEDKIGNIYVKGYASAVLSGQIDSSEISFTRYLENFYDRERPLKFLKEVLSSIFPDKVIIAEIGSLSSSPIPIDQFEKLVNSIYEETISSVKGGYRTEEENKEVAKTDAKLFLTTYYLNGKLEGYEEILAGSHYILTSSIRTSRCASKLGLSSNIIIKPNTIIGLLERIGHFQASASEIVDLFDNPYLVDAVNSSWDDIKTLVDSGVSLKGKNIIRLRWELDDEIKAYIERQNKNASNEEEADVKVQVTDLFSLLKNIKSKGYKLIPELEILEAKIEELESNAQANKEQQKILEEELNKFGKKRQHYFDSIRRKSDKRSS